MAGRPQGLAVIIFPYIKYDFIHTPEQTPEQPPEQTPEQSPEQTPKQTPDPTPGQTPEQTPGQTSEHNLNKLQNTEYVDTDVDVDDVDDDEEKASAYFFWADTAMVVPTVDYIK